MTFWFGFTLSAMSGFLPKPLAVLSAYAGGVLIAFDVWGPK